MSRKKVIVGGVLVAALAVAVIVGVLLVQLAEFGKSLDRLFTEGLLGPEAERQRVEIPAFGVSVAVAPDRAVDVVPRTSEQDDRAGLVGPCESVQHGLEILEERDAEGVHRGVVHGDPRDLIDNLVLEHGEIHGCPLFMVSYQKS